MQRNTKRIKEIEKSNTLFIATEIKIVNIRLTRIFYFLIDLVVNLRACSLLCDLKNIKYE